MLMKYLDKALLFGGHESLSTRRGTVLDCLEPGILIEPLILQESIPMKNFGNTQFSNNEVD